MTATYDPERALWVPGRRRFLFMSGLAMAGTVLGARPAADADPMIGMFYEIGLWKPVSAWTTPRTWSDSPLVTAAVANAQLKQAAREAGFR